MADWHFIPEDSLFEHVVSDDCACGPEMVEQASDQIAIHQALDGRERLVLVEATEIGYEQVPEGQ